MSSSGPPLSSFSDRRSPICDSQTRVDLLIWCGCVWGKWVCDPFFSPCPYCPKETHRAFGKHSIIDPAALICNAKVHPPYDSKACCHSNTSELQIASGIKEYLTSSVHHHLLCSSHILFNLMRDSLSKPSPKYASSSHRPVHLQ